jgi:hypothetical protein
MDTNGERRPAKFVTKRWEPKKWLVVYDTMILMHVAGKSNREIATELNYHEVQVGNILRSRQAMIVKELVRRKLNEEITETIPEKLKRLEMAALGNVEAALTNATLQEKSPLALMDRSLAFLKGIGKLEGEKSSQTINIVNIANEQATQLIAGMHKADEAMRLHGGVEVKTLPPGK